MSPSIWMADEPYVLSIFRKAGLYTPTGSVYVLDSGSIDHTIVTRKIINAADRVTVAKNLKPFANLNYL